LQGKENDRKGIKTEATLWGIGHLLIEKRGAEEALKKKKKKGEERLDLALTPT